MFGFLRRKKNQQEQDQERAARQTRPIPASRSTYDPYTDPLNPLSPLYVGNYIAPQPTHHSEPTQHHAAPVHHPAPTHDHTPASQPDHGSHHSSFDTGSHHSSHDFGGGSFDAGGGHSH